MNALGRLWQWIITHPFRSSVIVMLIIVTPGFIQIHEAQEEDRALAEANQRQAARNTAIVDCLTTYAAELTLSLQQRDAVAFTARSAGSEAWDTLQDLVEGEEAPPNARKVLFRAIDRYQRILDRLNRTHVINPYPDISDCLERDVIAKALPFQLISFESHGPRCDNRPITIFGGPGSEIIFGTDHNDVIKGFRGDDLIHSGRGNDVICGGRGDDTINGGPGRDHGRGQRGNDFCTAVEFRRSC